jgi:hypothetical protein
VLAPVGARRASWFVIGTVTDDNRLLTIPKLSIAALRFTATARARIEKGSTEEQSVGTGRGAESKLVESQSLTTGLLNASAGHRQGALLRLDNETV